MVAKTRLGPGMNKTEVNELTPAQKARHTDKWTEIICRAVTSRRTKRWKFVSFRGAAGGEWRGVVDMLAIRKATAAPNRSDLKAGDLFEIVLIQMKGGSARKPGMEERRRLDLVAQEYSAKAVILFEWDRGKVTRFSKLTDDLEWATVHCEDVF
jgi:hypothetical protein